MAKDLTKILKGVTDIILSSCSWNGAARVWDPTNPDTFPMLHLGFSPENDVTVKLTKIDVPEIAGGRIQVGFEAEVMAPSMEISDLDLAAVQKLIKSPAVKATFLAANEKSEAWDLHVEVILEEALQPKATNRYQVRGSVFYETLGAAGYPVALGSALVATNEEEIYRTVIQKTRRQDLALSIIPDLGNFGQATKIYTSGPNRYTGTLYNGPSWNTAPGRLTFDGVNDYGDLGDIIDDDGVSDFMIEVWARILGADATTQRLLSKATDDGTNGAGWSLFRHSTNAVRFKLADGSNNTTFGTTNLLQNAWAHIVVSVDRNGTGTLYVNGVAAGSSSMAALGSGANAVPLYMARNGSAYANVDLGRIRAYRFAAGGLPTDIATQIATHFNAERTIYGV